MCVARLPTCAKCGSRYQGATRHKGKPRADGTKVVSMFYGCGGHITKGNSVCGMNPIREEELETAVIEAVLGLCAP